MLFNKIKKYIKIFLKRKTRIVFIKRMIENINNEDFMKKVINLERNPNILEYIHYGNKNKNKVIYYIDIKAKNSIGFFAFYYDTLLGLLEAERWNFVPVVRYSGNCVYKEDEMINGTDNPFEYYFKPVSKVSIEEVYESDRVINFKWIYVEKYLISYKVNDDFIKKLSKLAKKYIVLNDITEKYIYSCINKIFFNKEREKILGVHIRGTDFALHWEQHPNIVELDDFIKEIDKAMENDKFEYIFLATDDKNRLDVMKKRYGHKLIYYKDVNRGSGIKSSALEKNNRDSNKYLNGLEVLKDAYTLVECGGLIAGLSNVSIGARIIKYSQDKKYNYLRILNKGIYRE